MTTAPLIELNDVSRWYGEVIGINRVTTTVKPGITGLLGPNGAGKSTMMNLITGMIRPSTGGLTIYGSEPFNNPWLMERLGYCMQPDTFYEKFTGLDFIQSLLEVRGWMRSKARAAALHALEQLQMTPHGNRRIQSYSKGMRQRTKVALAIAHNPEIIVLDEPMDGLDAVGRFEMTELIRRFGREGRNVVISSHVLHEIEAMTNNILMISGGYLLAEGEVREVRESLRQHPHKIIVRCSAPRAAAVFFLEQPQTLSVKVEENDHVIVVETACLSSFNDSLNTLVLERSIDVSLVTVADENITSIFGYLAASGGGATTAQSR
ncbi:MAG TPA: ABC transporter ATP-binding protein [Candidatus Sumerlaeota bacterium]|nr:ABC transporter ATP-binding protein [Candidatus Sumerlaeota bacterium]